MANSCSICGDTVSKLKKVEGQYLCNNCNAMKELTLDGEMNEEYVAVCMVTAMPSAGGGFYLLMFTKKQVVIVLYEEVRAEVGRLSREGAGVRQDWGYHLKSTRMKIRKEIASNPPQVILQAHEKNMAIAYDDLVKIDFWFFSRAGARLALVTQDTEIQFNFAKHEFESLQKILGPLLGEKLGRREDKKCFIATVAFSENFNTEVFILTKYRDEILSLSTIGRLIIRVYYKVGPWAASVIEVNDKLRACTRILLNPLVKYCRLRLKIQAKTCSH